MANNRSICSILVVLSIAFLSYFNTFANSFHFDDYSYIVHNKGVTDYTDHLSIQQTIRHILSNLSNRSIVLATLYLNHFLGGFNVFGFHVGNIIIHLIMCLLIFLFVKESLCLYGHLKIQNNHKNNLNVPLIAALLFAIHPVNTQAVTYITGRTTSLSVCFYMASFLFFIKGIRQQFFYKVLFFIVSMMFLIAGYGSKMIILTAPVMFILYYWFFTSLKANFLKRFFDSRFAVIFIKSFVISSPFILIFISRYLNLEVEDIVDENIVLFSKLPRPIISKLFFLSVQTRDFISSSDYLLTEFKVIIFYYIKMIFFPFNQNIDPDFPVAHGIMDPGVLLSLLIILLCLFAGIHYYKKNRFISFGIFWFFITLSLTSSVIPLRDLAVEHRLYLPLIGVVLIISVFLNLIISVSKMSSVKQLACFTLLVFLPIIVFSSLAIKRNFVWKDEKSLWSDAAKKSPRLSRPLNNLAEAYDKIGLAYGDKKEFEKAIHALNKALSISPTGYKSYNNLGKIYGRLGQYDPAIENLKLALKYNPDYPIAHYNLGKIYELKGMLDNAIEEYSTAFKQQDDFFEACFNLANAYDQKGQHKKALDTYFTCRKFKPSFPKVYFAIGNIYIKTGNLDKAFKYYSLAVELDRNYHPAKIAIANIFVMKKNFSEALEIYRQVVKSDPNNYDVHNNLGLVFFQHMNNPARAVYHFKKSLEINPEQQKAVLLRELIKNIKKDK